MMESCKSAMMDGLSRSEGWIVSNQLIIVSHLTALMLLCAAYAMLGMPSILTLNYVSNALMVAFKTAWIVLIIVTTITITNALCVQTAKSLSTTGNNVQQALMDVLSWTPMILLSVFDAF